MDLILNARLDVGVAPAIGIARPLAVIGAGALPQRHTRKVAAGAASIESWARAEEGGATIAAINTMKGTTPRMTFPLFRPEKGNDRQLYNSRAITPPGAMVGPCR